MAAKTIHALSGYNWFPGHMAKGMREALNKAQRCHLVIEVHDARIPFTGRNEKLKFSENRKILVLNKYDLIDRRRKLFDEIEGVPVIWTNSKSKHHSSMGKLREKIVSMTQDQKRLHDGIKVMIVGMPNVGKSSLINSLRRDAFGEGTKAAATSPYPGHTKMLSTFIKISGDPLIKMYDTPGIMIPNIKNKEMALKLAAIGTIDQRFIDEEVLIEYILKTLNHKELLYYIDKYELKGPCTDSESLLKGVAKRLGAKMHGGQLDKGRAATHFIKSFREGKLGVLSFDDF